MRRKGETGLFAGVREVADKALDVSNYATIRAALTLKKRGYGSETATLVPALFHLLSQNWAMALPSAPPSGPPSEQNFRWHCPQTYIAKHNVSSEVTLERNLICALVDAGRDDWSNQVPLISGISGPHAFKRRAIDLVQRQGERSFEFVELKVNSDTPVFAAIEMLIYGFLWLLSRRDRQILRYAAGPILDAQQIGLSVLAPRDYYHRYLVDPLASAINEGLRNLCQQNGVIMKFRFTAFPASFTWSSDPVGPPRPYGNDLIALLDGRETV